MNRKRRLLFCVENFQHGGINKALENIISLIDRDSYDLGIFVANQEQGSYKATFSPFLKYDGDNILRAFCTNYRKHTGFSRYFLILFKAIRKFFQRLGVDIFDLYLNRWVRRISDDGYDCVVSFAEGYITKFVSKVKGHKVAWIHIDYKRHLQYVGRVDELDIYRRFDSIVIPSQFSGKSFIDCYPELTDRVVVIPNVIDIESVRQKSGEESCIDHLFSLDNFNIVSVGRICYEKRFFEIPKIADSIRQNNVNFRWYIIGDGSDVETNILLEEIKKYNVSEFVVPLGRKNNPYPYIAKSDLLVSTSFSETFSYVVFEAKSLGIPVVCADFGTATEILTEDEGVICPLPSMADEIERLIGSHMIDRLKQNLVSYNYDNKGCLDKMYGIL